MKPRHCLALVLTIPAVFAALSGMPSQVLAAACDNGATSLANGGFESPGVPSGDYAIFDAADVSPWNTTDVANGIEIWGDGFQGVPAWEGGSFAELNANSAGTLYQDVVTFPGATMTWTLRHRGRDGTDVMRVLIGDASTADVWSDAGWDSISSDITDSETAWGTASGSYVVPAGQTCTRFGFRAVSSGVGSPSYGNFLDGIEFEVSIPADPTPTPSPTASPTPSPTPEPTATPTPSPTPEPTPSEQPSAIPTVEPSGLVAAAGADRPRVTPPPTDTADDRTGRTPAPSTPIAPAAWILGLGTLAVVLLRRPLRGNQRRC